ncbi:MAE_28990/MAE_18760 family HEPN-like nuclease [Psychrobacter aestuarii]|nr:MAE_28990/MAE_18760 family HEPN-like nuclease [Psychrobacter aestuarii]
MELVQETESNIYNIEKIIYTGRYSYLENDFKVISKQSLVMLYSLWEGFVQDVFGIFLDEVNNNVNSIYDLKDDFMLSQVESTFQQFKEYPKKDNSRKKFHNGLFSFFKESNHNLNKIVRCNNNVEIDVLNKLLVTYCMDEIPNNWREYSRPNKNLKDTLKDFLHYRNNQAHGNRAATEVIVSHNDFEIYKKVVIDLIYEVSEKIEKCLTRKNYLKQNGVP